MIKRDYDEKTDIWAIGIILFELMTGAQIHGNKDVFEIVDYLKKGDIQLGQHRKLSDSAKDFL